MTGDLLHGLPPVTDERTRLLVLGSFPGVASLRAGQYYGHPRNHFWPILSALWRIDLVSLPYAERLMRLRDGGVGLWDVHARCRRAGSLDSAIEDAEPNDVVALARTLPALRAIAHNGGESARWMRRTQGLGVAVYRLPSTSPANARMGLAVKQQAWADVLAAAGCLPFPPLP